MGPSAAEHAGNRSRHGQTPCQSCGDQVPERWLDQHGYCDICHPPREGTGL